jgi:hypothetical protein
MAKTFLPLKHLPRMREDVWPESSFSGGGVQKFTINNNILFFKKNRLNNRCEYLEYRKNV